MLTKKSPLTDKKPTKTPSSRQAKESSTSLLDQLGEARPAKATGKRKISTKSCVVVHYDVGFHNFLTIRGKGANLSWNRGVLLKNIGADEWVWETDTPFDMIEFKILINDHHFEEGDNHSLRSGQELHHTPRF